MTCLGLRARPPVFTHDAAMVAGMGDLNRCNQCGDSGSGSSIDAHVPLVRCVLCGNWCCGQHLHDLMGHQVCQVCLYAHGACQECGAFTSSECDICDEFTCLGCVVAYNVGNVSRTTCYGCMTESDCEEAGLLVYTQPQEDHLPAGTVPPPPPPTPPPPPQTPLPVVVENDTNT